MSRISKALLHPYENFLTWLEFLNQAQPLILLSSVSIVIATFAASISPTAAGYAIGAAMAFISGFTSLILIRIFKFALGKRAEPGIGQLAILAWVFMGAGVILLFLIPGELANAIPALKRFGSYTSAAYFVGIALFMSVSFLVVVKPTSTRDRVMTLLVLMAANMGILSLAVQQLWPSLHDPAMLVSYLGAALMIVVIAVYVLLDFGLLRVREPQVRPVGNPHSKSKNKTRIGQAFWSRMELSEPRKRYLRLAVKILIVSIPVYVAGSLLQQPFLFGVGLALIIFVLGMLGDILFRTLWIEQKEP